jgi:hypothetical protein
MRVDRLADVDRQIARMGADNAAATGPGDLRIGTSNRGDLPRLQDAVLSRRKSGRSA